MKKVTLFLLILLLEYPLFSQSLIDGQVTDAKTGEPLIGALIKIANNDAFVMTDLNGEYTLDTDLKTPFTIEVSFGKDYQKDSAYVTDNIATVNFSLTKFVLEIIDEVVISASRIRENVKETPVTIERLNAKDAIQSSSSSFYDELENLKGIDINTSSLTFKSINTRGFANFSNVRFVQLIDGVDNNSPALNFAVGNLTGLNELDLEKIEILPGASSALYGANAFNGILFMTSKSPFEYKGVSAYLKSGVTMQKAAGNNPYYDFGIRLAHKFNKKVATKINFSYMEGTDWFATNYDMYDASNTPVGEPDKIYSYEKRGNEFDALNIYGDEITANIHDVSVQMEAEGLIPAGASVLIPDEKVSRTGYREIDLTDNKVGSIKADFAFHIKPWEDDKEFIINFHAARGNTLYQGGSRYYLKNFIMMQGKVEFRGDNFFVRGYSTMEDAGDSYDVRFAGINMNKSNAEQWYGAHVGAYLNNISLGGSSENSHQVARTYADSEYTPQPDTDAFNTLFNSVINDSDIKTGAKFVDNSKINHIDANYNFRELINEWVDILLGGSFRQNILNSSGTIFTDYDGPINYNEYGAYIQLSKKFANEHLKFTGSARYDKGQNFDGNISPRLALVYSLGSKKNHNFRLSFQTGFRNPTTQNQYVGYDFGNIIIIGSAKNNLDRFTSNPIAISSTSQYLVNTFGAGGLSSDVKLSGRIAYENAFTLSSVIAGTPEKAITDLVKPERITAYEFGYRGKISNFYIDFNVYYNEYESFISGKTVVVPNFGFVNTVENTSSNPDDVTDLTAIGQGPTPNALIALSNKDFTLFRVITNSDADISSYGSSLGLSANLGDFDFGANYTYARFIFDQILSPDHNASFNTPEHKLKISFGKSDLFKNLGFKINYRYNTEYLWQQAIADALIPANSVFDAQITYRVPKLKSLIKIGGTNIGGNEYRSSPGVGYIGSQYYISFIINP